MISNLHFCLSYCFSKRTEHTQLFRRIFCKALIRWWIRRRQFQNDSPYITMGASNVEPTPLKRNLYIWTPATFCTRNRKIRVSRNLFISGGKTFRCFCNEK